MGEAKRRKKLDPNYGKCKYLELFKNSTPLDENTKITHDTLFEFALLFVPKNILNDFIKFQFLTENEDVPEEILSEYPAKYPRGFMEIDWHEPTTNWISNFIFESHWCRGFSELQLKNALHNIRKAILIFSNKHLCMFSCDPEDFPEWKDLLIKANSKLPKQYQGTFDDSWIPFDPKFNY